MKLSHILKSSDPLHPKKLDLLIKCLTLSDLFLKIYFLKHYFNWTKKIEILIFYFFLKLFKQFRLF